MVKSLYDLGKESKKLIQQFDTDFGDPFYYQVYFVILIIELRRIAIHIATVYS